MTDPQVLRNSAKTLEAEGHPVAASQMREAADDIEQFQTVVSDLRVKLRSIVDRIDNE